MPNAVLHVTHAERRVRRTCACVRACESKREMLENQRRDEVETVSGESYVHAIAIYVVCARYIRGPGDFLFHLRVTFGYLSNSPDPAAYKTLYASERLELASKARSRVAARRSVKRICARE